MAARTHVPVDWQFFFNLSAFVSFANEMGPNLYCTSVAHWFTQHNEQLQ